MTTLEDLTFKGRRIRLAEYQKSIIKSSFNAKKYLIVLASTRSGKTFTCSLIALLHAQQGRNVIIVSPTFQQSTIMYRTIRDLIVENELHELLDLEREQRQDLMTFRNGSRIKVLSAHNPESLLGWGADTIIVDEASLIPDDVYELYILRMLMNNQHAKLICISTTQTKNFLYKLATDSISVEEKDVIRITVEEAIKAGIMSERMVEEAKKALTEEEFRVWYMAEFPEVAMSEYIDPTRLEQVFVKRQLDFNTQDGRTFRIGSVDIGRYNDYTVAVIGTVIIKEANLEESVLVVEDALVLKNLNLMIQAEQLLTFFSNKKLDAIVVDAQGLGAGVYDYITTKFESPWLLKRMQWSSEHDAVRQYSYQLLGRLINTGRVDFSAVDKYKTIITEHFKNIKVEHDGKIKKSSGGNDDFVDALMMLLFILLREFRFKISVGRINTPNYMHF